MGRHVVCKVGEIPVNSGHLVKAEGREIAVFNLGDRYRAIANRCPHEGADLCRGKIAAFVDATSPGQFTVDESRVMVRCPWHGWEFDVETGRSYCDPNRVRVKAFEVDVGDVPDDHGRLEGPYEVETYEVSTEGRYVVLTI